MALLATKWPHSATPFFLHVPEAWRLHFHQFGASFSERKKREKWRKPRWRLETRVLAGRVPSLITLLNVFKGISLWKLDAFDYFHVWGTQICRENILFRTKRPSFWCFKISVHLGLKEQIFTWFCFDWFGGCRSPNQSWLSFFESPICLVCCPKISTNESLYFGSYRSWSGVCSQEIRTRVTNFTIFVWGFQIIKRGDSFS